MMEGQLAHVLSLHMAVYVPVGSCGMCREALPKIEALGLITIRVNNEISGFGLILDVEHHSLAHAFATVVWMRNELGNLDCTSFARVDRKDSHSGSLAARSDEEPVKRAEHSHIYKPSRSQYLVRCLCRH